MIKAIVFDMDGVLLDSEKVMRKCWTRAGREMGFKRCVEAAEKSMGRNREGVKKLFEEKFPEVKYSKFYKLYTKYIADYFAKNGVPRKNGVLETLEILKLKKFKTGIATSTSSEHAIPQLKSSGIYNYADEVYTGDEVKHGKPDPEIYEDVCKALKVKPEEAIAVEDSPNGLKSAYKAGMKAVYIPDIAVIPEKYKKYIYKTFPSMTAFGNYVASL